MPTLKEQIDFAEGYITAPDGRPFSLKGRQYVLDQMWKPLRGWKLWPVDESKLCDACAAQAGTISEDYHASDVTRSKVHEKEHGCLGLSSNPIIFVGVKMKRQQGKTFNAAAWAMSLLVMEEMQSIALLAGSEKQVERFFNKNYKKPIEASEELSEHLITRGTRVICEETGSDIEILPCSLSSVGDTRTAVIVDECRIVPPDIAAGIINTIISRGGWECTVSSQHYKTHDGVSDSDAKRKCPVCKRKTSPWYGKVLLCSSEGEDKEDDSVWFSDWVDKRKQEPDKNTHVFASRETLNPKSSQEVLDGAITTFGDIDGISTHMKIEAGGERLKKGEDVVTQADVKRVSDKSLQNEDSTRNRAVGFLDSSNSVEKTSLVIIADDEEQSQSPWEHVYLSHLKFWWPGKNIKSRLIDPDEVERHLEFVLPMYPNLVVLEVDPKLGARRAKDPKIAWPVTMMRNIRGGGSEKWRQKLKVWRPDSVQDDIGWDELERRILNQTMTLQWVKEIFDEFKGITRNKNMQVVDRNRDKMHADIIKAIACALFRIRLLQLRKGGPSMASLQARVRKTPGRSATITGRRLTENDF